MNDKTDVELNTEVEMIDVEKAKALAGCEPNRLETQLLSIIVDREEQYKRLMDENSNLRNEYAGYRTETSAILGAQRKENTALRDRLEGAMREIFDRQTNALERIAEILEAKGR